MSKLLEVKNLKKGEILRGISFDLHEGEMVAIMGPSGSGKSTLLYNVSGMDRSDEGEVFLSGTEIRALREDEIAGIRLHRMGFVFQQMNCLSNLDLIDNIVFPAIHADRKNKDMYYARARELMAKFHIEDIAERKINEVFYVSGMGLLQVVPSKSGACEGCMFKESYKGLHLCCFYK